MATRKIKSAGRPKGAVNKLSATTKENIIGVFMRVGGISAMTEWAMENKTEFYKLYARLIPVEVDANVGGSITVIDRDPTLRPDNYGRKGKAST